MEPESLINDRYRVLRKLGAGGFGEVHLARDEKLDIEVAVKILHPHLAPNRRITNRLQEELKVSLAIHSPHVARVLEVGEIPGGSAYQVLTYVDGQGLDQVLAEQGPLPRDRALQVTIAISRALVALHGAGVIHRDLKPANVSIPRRDTGLVYADACLLDLGLSGDLLQDTGTTQTGQLYGTPRYMAPEQISAGAQSPATDIYGLGLLLYEMLVGHSPFQANSSFIELARSVVSEPVAFPPEVRLPASVEGFIRRCLEKDPRHRFADAAAAGSALQDLLAGAEQTTPREQTGASALPFPDAPPMATPVSRFAQAAVAGVLIIALGIVGVFASDTGVFIPLVVGVALMAGGFVLAMALRRFIQERRTQVDRDVDTVVWHTRSKESLTESLARDVEELFQLCNRVDDRMLVKSLAIMYHEYQEARDSGDRQRAVMNLADLLERIRKKLSPWYVRQEKLLTAMVAIVGLVSGLLSVAQAVGGLF